MLIFDAETGPLEESVLLEMYTPLDESEIKDLVTGDFDPSTVKVGNLKDPTKIEAKITEVRNAHETAGQLRRNHRKGESRTLVELRRERCSVTDHRQGSGHRLPLDREGNHDR